MAWYNRVLKTDTTIAAPINSSVIVKITQRRRRTIFHRSSKVRASGPAFIEVSLIGEAPVCTLCSIGGTFLTVV